MYYDGEQPLPIALATEQYRREFGNMIGAVRDNWMPLVIDAKSQRLTPVGFRFGSPTDDEIDITKPIIQADQDANRIWQENYLDADSKMAHSTALTTGRCPIMIWKGNNDQAEITIEHPASVYVAYGSGGSRRHRVAAIKRWTDEWTGGEFINLYLPEGIHKYHRAKKGDRLTARDTPLPNPLKAVPILELRHRMRHRDGQCRSALMEVTSTQDQLTKTLIDTLVAAEFQAFRQRWATGIEIPKDPDTGEPVMPFKSAINRIWTTPNDDADFGEFSQVDLTGYTRLREHLIQSLASRTATPPHYLINGQTLPNAESVKAAETGLVASVRDSMVSFGETWEHVMRMAFHVQGDERRGGYTRAETLWKDPETRSEAEHIDAVLKRKPLNIPLRQLWEDAGYTPEQMGRFSAMLVQEALERERGKTIDEQAQWAEQIRAKGEALGVLARSGVTLESAARVLGLEDLEFRDGVMPVTLAPES
jgi:hypothetical protein